MDTNWDTCRNIVNSLCDVCKSTEEIYMNDDKKLSLIHLDNITTLHCHLRSMNDIMKDNSPEKENSIKLLIVYLRSLRDKENDYMNVFNYKLLKNKDEGKHGRELLSKLLQFAKF